MDFIIKLQLLKNLLEFNQFYKNEDETDVR